MSWLGTTIRNFNGHYTLEAWFFYVYGYNCHRSIIEFNIKYKCLIRSWIFILHCVLKSTKKYVIPLKRILHVHQQWYALIFSTYEFEASSIFMTSGRPSRKGVVWTLGYDIFLSLTVPMWSFIQDNLFKTCQVWVPWNVM